MYFEGKMRKSKSVGHCCKICVVGSNKNTKSNFASICRFIEAVVHAGNLFDLEQNLGLDILLWTNKLIL